MAERSSSQAAGNDRPQPAPPAADLTSLVVAHHAAVYRYACRLCGCPTEAEDLAQQAFLVAQRKLHQLREPDRACAWLLTVVRSCFLKSIRKRRPLAARDVNLDVEQVAIETPQVQEIDGRRLAEALAELAEEFRIVLLMFYFEDLSYQEIAQQLEIPVGTVMSRLSRAKGHLRRRLGRAEDDELRVVPRPRISAAAWLARVDSDESRAKPVGRPRLTPPHQPT